MVKEQLGKRDNAMTYTEALALRHRYQNATIKQAAEDMGLSHYAARRALNMRKCVRFDCGTTVAFKVHCPAHMPEPGTPEYYAYYL